MARAGPGRPALLSREQVGRAAFDLVDAEGAAALTIGRLARDLGVSPMTVYGYAENKDAIIAMLPELLLADLPSISMQQPWEVAVEGVYLSVYRRFIEHRHVLQMIADAPVFGRAQAQVLEGVLERLGRAGFGDEEAFALQRTVAIYTVGFALFAVAERSADTRPRTTWADELDPADFPRIARISTVLEADVDEAQFLGGLRRILGATG
jgi:AcrR family transcriptional regulator